MLLLERAGLEYSQTQVSTFSEKKLLGRCILRGIICHHLIMEGVKDHSQDAEPKTIPVKEGINWQWYDAKIARYACRLDISSNTDSPMTVVGKIPGGSAQSDGVSGEGLR